MFHAENQYTLLVKKRKTHNFIQKTQSNEIKRKKNNMIKKKKKKRKSVQLETKILIKIKSISVRIHFKS